MNSSLNLGGTAVPAVLPGVAPGKSSTSPVAEKWLGLHAKADRHPFYQKIRSGDLPESDWARYSPDKCNDFLKTVLASFALLENGQPFSTVETGVFAGGTSAIFLHALALHFQSRSIHVGIDPYFATEQSYPEYGDTYGLDPYLVCLRDLGRISHQLRVPYVPFLTSSTTFMRKDLLPAGQNFRLFHLDGDHTAPAVTAELTYFSAKAAAPAIFILDDLGHGFPEVDDAIAAFHKAEPRFTELKRFLYDTRAGEIGFGVFHLSA